MRYPNCETAAERRKAVRDMEARVAKTYAEAESYAEFDLKRMTFAPRHVFFNDMFRMHYFYSNGRAWLYRMGWVEFPLMTVSAIICLASVVSYNVGRVSLASAIVAGSVSAAAFCAGILYSRSRSVALKARQLLRDLDYSYAGI